MGLIHIFKPDVDELFYNLDIRGLIKALNYKGDKNVQRDAIEALGNIGKPAIIPLISGFLITGTFSKDIPESNTSENGSSMSMRYPVTKVRKGPL